jgi:hypothetical protein
MERAPLAVSVGDGRQAARQLLVGRALAVEDASERTEQLSHRRVADEYESLVAHRASRERSTRGGRVDEGRVRAARRRTSHAPALTVDVWGRGVDVRPARQVAIIVLPYVNALHQRGLVNTRAARALRRVARAIVSKLRNGHRLRDWWL